MQFINRARQAIIDIDDMVALYEVFREEDIKEMRIDIRNMYNQIKQMLEAYEMIGDDGSIDKEKAFEVIGYRF